MPPPANVTSWPLLQLRPISCTPQYLSGVGLSSATSLSSRSAKRSKERGVMLSVAGVVSLGRKQGKTKPDDDQQPPAVIHAVMRSRADQPVVPAESRKWCRPC